MSSLVFTWKGNKDTCSSGSSVNRYNCSRGKTKKSIVPKWSRPVENMGKGNKIIITPGPDGDGSIEYQYRDMGPPFKARPIKHWRKQLAPRITTGYSTAATDLTMDRPGGSNYRFAESDNNDCCTTQDAYHISTYIPKEPQSKTVSYLIVEPSCNNINPVFNKAMCCNPESNIIKSATTLLKSNYYTDSRAYLKSRCRLYNQRLSGIRAKDITYFDADGNPLHPTDNPRGPQVRAMNNCYECTDTTATCYGAPKKHVIGETIYKPSNPQFAVEGAVSSSARLDRLKLNTIQKSGSNQRSAWGNQSARAAAYNGKSYAPYYIKSKYSGDIKCKSEYHRNGNRQLCKD